MIPRRRLFTGATSLALVGAALITTSASGTTQGDAAFKPVIGKPSTAPAQAVAGKPFTITFKVTRSDTRGPLAKATIVSDLTVGGAKVRHTKSFRRGAARLTLVVPASAQGKVLKAKLTVTSAGKSSSRSASFPVRGAPAISIAAASGVEGNTGTTTLSFPVTLSAPSAQAVTVGYATADGSAVAPGDYAAASGTLTFQPGEKTKAVTVNVVADLAIESDESFSLALSNPVGASIATGTATGTITNDDTAVPVTPGAYKGATQEGNYVFLTVTPNRTITGFRVNDMPETCDGPISLYGVVDWSDSTFTIAADGSFRATGSWTGSDVQGDVEWTNWSAELNGVFGTPTTATGTIIISNELNYKGTHYRCSTAVKTWSATLQ